MIILNNEIALLGVDELLRKSGCRCHLVSRIIAEDADSFGSQLANVINAAIAGKSFNQALQSANIASANNAAPSGGDYASVSKLQ